MSQKKVCQKFRPNVVMGVFDFRSHLLFNFSFSPDYECRVLSRNGEQMGIRGLEAV